MRKNSDIGVEEGARLADVLGAFAFANDLAFGLAHEDSIRSCYLAIRIGERLELTPAEQHTLYYASLLKDAGCTSWTSTLANFWEADEIVARRELMIFGGADNLPSFVRWLTRYVGVELPLHRRLPHAIAVARRQPEIAREGFAATGDIAMNIAGRLGMPADVRIAVGCMFEHWDGHGMPSGIGGTVIPLASRVIYPTFTLAPVARRLGREAAIALAQRERAAAFDPRITDAFLELAGDEAFWAEFEGVEVWERVLAREPRPRPAPLTGEQLDNVALAFADFTDLKAPHVLAHSRRTAALAETMARGLHCTEQTAADIRRAALVHDLGLVAIASHILAKPEAELTAAEREQIRLHPYYGERILSRAPALASLAEIAGLHHERVDGSGYVRGLSDAQIPLPSRIIAVAAHFDELTHDAPGRPAMRAEEAIADLRHSGYTLEVTTALEAALGLRPSPPASRPGGLTEREIDVLRLAARGLTRREISHQLHLSENTVRHHMEHIYNKAGVSNRVAAAMFAMEHGLLD